MLYERKKANNEETLRKMKSLSHNFGPLQRLMLVWVLILSTFTCVAGLREKVGS